MTSSKTKSARFSSSALVFIIIVVSTITAESLCHAFMHTKLSTLNTNHLLIVSSAAILATFLIVSLFLRTRQLSMELKTKDFFKSDEVWERTFNTMTDFVSVHDKDFRVVKANQALCDFLGKSSEEIIGKRCYQLFHDMDEPFENCPHKKTSETGHPITEIIRDTNIGVPLQITCSPLLNDDNTFQGSVHIARAYEAVDNRRNKAQEVIPICAACKSIRKEKDTWVTPEDYFVKKYDSQFTHTICKDCREKLYPEYIK